MKKDTEVRLLQRERQKGSSQAAAAARAGMSERTARKYERLGRLPSQVRERRDYCTRPDPFIEDWPWVQEQLERDSALQAVTLFALLCAEHPGRYQEGQVRTLQRHVQLWRALHGPEQEVMFAQRHEPGEAAQSDFTHMTDLAVTLGGAPFAHMVFHLVLTYSNMEAITLCFSESFEALAEGIESCLWQLGGVHGRLRRRRAPYRPVDGGGAASGCRGALRLERPLRRAPGALRHGADKEPGRRGAPERRRGAEPPPLQAGGGSGAAGARPPRLHRPPELRALPAGVGDPTQSHPDHPFRCRAGGVASVAGADPFGAPLLPCREVRALVGQGSTIQVLGNGYSVPSRLIGTTLTVRVRAETLEAYVGTALARPPCGRRRLPRLAGKGQVRIDYRHIAWSLVRNGRLRRRRGVRRLPLPRGVVPDSLVPPGLRHPPGALPHAGGPRVRAGPPSGGQYDGGRRGDGAGAAP